MSLGYLSKSGAVDDLVDAMSRSSQPVEAKALPPAKSTGADSLARLRRLPVDTRPPLEFRGLQKSLTIDLKSGMWSRKVILPNGKLRFSISVQPPNGYYIWFESDERPIEIKADGTGLSAKRAFWLIGKEDGQKAEVNVDYLPLTMEDLKTPW